MINGMAACSLSYMAGLYGVYGVSDRVSGLLQGNEIFPQMWLQFSMVISFFFFFFQTSSSGAVQNHHRL